MPPTSSQWLRSSAPFVAGRFTWLPAHAAHAPRSHADRRKSQDDGVRKSLERKKVGIIRKKATWDDIFKEEGA